MSLLRNAALAAALTLAASAPASAAFLFDAGAASGLVHGDAVRAAVASYFDYDALLTVGVLAVAGGMLAALGSRRSRREAARDPEWRESVFQALQADLVAYAESYRRAA